MKPNISAPPQPEYQLRHRLAGAVIMVTVAVLVIPLLLSEQALETGDETGDAHTIATQKTFTSPIQLFPLDESVTSEVGQQPASESTDEPTDESVSEPVTEPTGEPVDAPVSQPASTQTNAQSAKLANEPAKPALLSDDAANNNQQATPPVPETSSDGWSVRVGTFSKQANIDSVTALLSTAGFTVNKTSVKTALGDTATRIWIGPYADKATAAEVSSGLQNLSGEPGFVTKHAP